MTSPNCVPIAQKIASMQQEVKDQEADLADADPREVASINREIARLRDKISYSERELAQCEAAQAQSDRLSPGDVLAANQSLIAPSGFARLTLQPDGNLVMTARRPGGDVPRWASGTVEMVALTCVMQQDGDLVLNNDTDQVWSSKTDSPGAYLRIQDDENLVIYQGETPIWASNTSLDGTPIKADGPEVFYLFKGVRHWIQDETTLERQFGGWGAVTTVTSEELSLWPQGENVPSADDPTGENVHICVDLTLSGPSLPPRGLPPTPPPRINPDGTVVGVSQAPLTGYTEKMWAVGSTIPVSMNGGSPFVRGKVQEWADTWSEHANIRFAWVESGGTIRVEFNLGKGSSSAVGRDALWVGARHNTINFGWLVDDTADSEFERVVVHEFGHALGLVHEHQSPSAGIDWDYEKTYAWFSEQEGWDREKVDNDLFKKYSVEQTNYSAFDPTSIMCYYIPPELTLDGKGLPGGSKLSDTDISYIARWYPFLPTPGAATGLLRPPDDCDEIDFLVEYGVGLEGAVEFSLTAGPAVTWWKAIEVPVGTSEYCRFETQDGHSDPRATLTQVDASRPIRFWKAKAFGAHTLLSYTWDVTAALPGGSRLSLRWKRDHC